MVDPQRIGEVSPSAQSREMSSGETDRDDDKGSAPERRVWGATSSGLKRHFEDSGCARGWGSSRRAEWASRSWRGDPAENGPARRLICSAQSAERSEVLLVHHRRLLDAEIVFQQEVDEWFTMNQVNRPVSGRSRLLLRLLGEPVSVISGW